MKKIVAFALVVAVQGIFGSSAYALEAGFLFGPNFSNLRNVEPSETPGETNSAKPGLSFGGYISMPVFPALSLEPGVLVSARAIEREQNDSISSIKNEGVFEVPVLLRFRGIPLLTVAAGPYFSYGAGKFKVTPKGASEGAEFTYAEAFFKRTDFGLVGAAGMKFKLAPATSLLADARYNYGLTNVRTFDGVDQRWKSIQILLGLSFGL